MISSKEIIQQKISISGEEFKVAQCQSMRSTSSNPIVIFTGKMSPTDTCSTRPDMDFLVQFREETFKGQSEFKIRDRVLQAIQTQLLGGSQ